MKQQQVRFAALSVAGLAFGVLLAGCADMRGSTSTSTAGTSNASASPAVAGLKPLPLNPALVGAAREVPTTLRTAPAQSMFLLVSGSGVQVYECTPRGAYFGWTFRAPEATLTDATGVTVGKHYAGPTWEATDGSIVVGTVTATSPATDTSAIPSLLLSVASTSGTGVLTQTRSIQRLQTVGGVMPTSVCSVSNAGEVARVPYAATYAFFRAAP